MIPHGVQIFVAFAPVDLRSSFDRLAGLAREHTGYDARSSALFVFFGRRRDAVKVLFADATGLCIFYKRLDAGAFRLPEPPRAGAAYVEVDAALLDALLDGVARERRVARRTMH